MYHSRSRVHPGFASSPRASAQRRKVFWISEPLPTLSTRYNFQSYFLLLTSYFLLPTSYFLLPTSYFLSQSQSQPQPYLPHHQMPLNPKSEIRNPNSVLLFIGFFPYFFPDKKVPKNHGCVKKAKTRRAFWREESRLLQHSSAVNRCTKITRTLPAPIAYDSSLYLFAAGFLNAFFTMPVLAFAGALRHNQIPVHAGFHPNI